MPIKSKTKKNYTATVVVTFTPEQKKLIEEHAAKVGLSMASFIRHKALESVTSSNRKSKSFDQILAGSKFLVSENEDQQFDFLEKHGLR